MKVLAIVPAYNEQKSILSTIETISKSSKVDILVINDGSVDDTEKILINNRINFVSHPYNLGYGVAIQTGYKYAVDNEYDLVIQLDADGQHDPKYIKSMIKMGEDLNLDVVIGSRFKINTGYHTSLTRRLGMVFFGKIVSLITNRVVTDSTSGYQVINKKALKFMCTDVFPCDFPDADLLILLYFAGFKVNEFSMKMNENTTGKSMHGSMMKNIYYFFKMSLSIFTIVLRKSTGLAIY